MLTLTTGRRRRAVAAFRSLARERRAAWLRATLLAHGADRPARLATAALESIVAAAERETAAASA